MEGGRRAGRASNGNEFRVLGQEHTSTLTSMANLAYIWKSQGRDEEAINLMKQAERLQNEVLGIDHPTH